MGAFHVFEAYYLFSGLLLKNLISVTILGKPYYLLCIPIMATSSKFFDSNQVLRWLKRLKLGRSVLRVVLTLGSLRAMAMAAKSPKRVCSQSHLEEHDGLRNRVAVY